MAGALAGAGLIAATVSSSQSLGAPRVGISAVVMTMAIFGAVSKAASEKPAAAAAAVPMIQSQHGFCGYKAESDVIADPRLALKKPL